MAEKIQQLCFSFQSLHYLFSPVTFSQKAEAWWMLVWTPVGKLLLLIVTQHAVVTPLNIIWLQLNLVSSTRRRRFQVQEKENMVTVNDSRMQQSKDSVRGKNNLLFSFTVFILSLFSFGLRKSKCISDVILKTFCYTLILLFGKIIKLNFVFGLGFCFFNP